MDSLAPQSLTISPDSDLLIKLCIEEESEERDLVVISQQSTRRQELPAKSDLGASETTSSLINPEHYNVFQMTTLELHRFQHEIIELERDNFTKLMCIGSNVRIDNRPFPVLVQSDNASPFGSPNHRSVLNDHFQNMLAIAKDPRRYLVNQRPAPNSVVPVSQLFSMDLVSWNLGIDDISTKTAFANSQKAQRMGSKMESTLDFQLQNQNKTIWAESEKASNFPPRLSRIPVDYEMQLKLLEEQNRKRLMLAWPQTEHNMEKVSNEKMGYETQLRRLEQENKKRLMLARPDLEHNSYLNRLQQQHFVQARQTGHNSQHVGCTVQSKTLGANNPRNLLQVEHETSHPMSNDSTTHHMEEDREINDVGWARKKLSNKLDHQLQLEISKEQNKKVLSLRPKV